MAAWADKMDGSDASTTSIHSSVTILSTSASSDDSAVGSGVDENNPPSSDDISVNRTTSSQKFSSFQDVKQYITKLRAESRNNSRCLNESNCSGVSNPANRTTESQKIEVQKYIAKLRAESRNNSLLGETTSTATSVDPDDELDDLAYCDRLREKFDILETRANSYYTLTY